MMLQDDEHIGQKGDAAVFASYESSVARSSEQMLDDARAVLLRKGRLTSALLDVAPGAASARQYIERFGSLGKLYELVGYEPSKRQRLTLERGVGKRRLSSG